MGLSDGRRGAVATRARAAREARSRRLPGARSHAAGGRRAPAGPVAKVAAMKLLVAAIVALVVAPTAGAAGWATFGSNVQNIVDPGVLRTRAGSELVSFESPAGNTISLSRNGGAARVLVASDPIAGETRLVQQPSGAIQLYFPNADGVARLTSTDDGETWTGPIQTQSHDVGGVRAAAVRSDGTPLFTQDGTGFVNVFQGLDGETVHNVFAPCCGYAESIAVDSTGLAQIAFWSNGTGLENFVYQTLDSTGATAAQSTPTGYAASATIPRDDRVPLAADAAGNTFLGYSLGYPSSKQFVVATYRGGALARKTTVATGAFGGADPHMALAVDGQSRLWAVWTQGGAAWAARSRTHGQSFGAHVRIALPGSCYQLEELARADGSVVAYANFGSTLASTRLLPGLTVRVQGRTVAVSDDGFPVAGATISGAGRTLHTNAGGRAGLAGVPRGAAMRVSKPGYAAAGFRLP